ncbi:hypothetical protein U8335_14235 [Roseiconus lacunae]|uniref:hypothetical protein n=1 Tax=Roseiconus lacunae TaxID=2605694 RepID=UPI0030873F5B|nr:hypothetical protein U8335_14235 [Stieleria sp. HD01]
MWNDQHQVVMGTSGSRGAPSGRAIWQWSGEQWDLKLIQSDNNGVAGDPPSLPGRFKGQLRATPCVETLAT